MNLNQAVGLGEKGDALVTCLLDSDGVLPPRKVATGGPRHHSPTKQKPGFHLLIARYVDLNFRGG